ncbi:MAG: hypothetical protein IJS60_04315 [Abditibacteriota bacterium]|nr:hypothetical protein [Abditibacteriota bacterium]
MFKYIILILSVLIMAIGCQSKEDFAIPIDAKETGVSVPLKAIFPNSGPWGLVIHCPYADISEIHTQWVRIGGRWDTIERIEGKYDFKETDKLIDFYKEKYNIIFILNLEEMPKCYKDRKDNKEFIIKKIGNFATACAKRYKGKKILWEISNEPEVFPMDGYMKNPPTYTQIARLCAKNIKKYDPKSKIAVCSVAWADRSFIEACLQNHILADGTIDTISFHGYHRKNYLPESALVEDIKWMREQCKKFSPDKYVSIIDTERGFGILDGDPFQPRHKGAWRNYVTTRTTQAAYLARHYFEEIYNQIEIIVWYKDCIGETAYSLYPGYADMGLSPMGLVYKNMASLFSENSTKLVNDRYRYNLKGDNSEKLFHRSLLSKKSNNKKGDRLFITCWNPVEAFEGKILDYRKLDGDYYKETWRDIRDTDVIDITTDITIDDISQVKNVYIYDLLSKNTEEGYKKTDYEIKDNKLIVKDVKSNAMPALVIIDL